MHYIFLALSLSVCMNSLRKQAQNSSAPPPESPPKELASSSPSQVSPLPLTCLSLPHIFLKPHLPLHFSSNELFTVPMSLFL